MSESLLKKSSRKYVLFPIQYPKIWEAYKKQEQAFWTAEEIDFSADISDWDKLNKNEQIFIENILAFFAGSDGIIMENVGTNFKEEIEIPEVRLFYGFQEMMEGIHSECYSLMIETYVKDSVRKNELYNAIELLPAIKDKAEWATKWLDTNKHSFGKRLVAFAIVEGIFFAGSFCAIFWLKHNKSLMTKALCKSNELISRDESLHVEFAALLYSYVENKLSEEEIHELFREAVEIEKKFIIESLQVNLLGMNKDKMKQYIEFVSDRLLNQLGYSKLFNVEQPFSFMDSICLEGKTNFFEQRVTEYNRAEQLNTNAGIENVDVLDNF
jgi:ribonucleoside-diphosphate reductase beta chain